MLKNTGSDSTDTDFASSCSGNFPNSLKSDDTTYENAQSTSANKFYGILVNTTYSGIPDDASCDLIQVCFKWWQVSAGDQCGASYSWSAVNIYNSTDYVQVDSNCPTSEAGSISCVNVTNYFPQQCGSLFSTTGNVRVRIQQRGDANDNSNYDVVYYNVTHTRPDLQIFRESPKTVGMSKTFMVRFILRNRITTNLSNVMLNDTIPSGWSYSSCSPSDICGYDSGNSRVYWNVSTLANNSIRSDLNYTVTSPSSGSGTFNSVASCPDCKNDVESFSVNVDTNSLAHYAVDLDPDVRDKQISTSTNFNFKVTNIGNADISSENNANLNIYLNASFTSVTSSCTVTGGGSVVWNISCPISSLNQGSSTSVSFTATTPSAIGIFPNSTNITGNATFTVSTSSDLVQNGNYTGGSSTAWTYAENDAGGVATSTFDTTGGNLDAGVWYLYVNDNSNKNGYTVYSNLTNDGTSWTAGEPQSATLQFAYKQTWATAAPASNEIRVYLIKPDNSEQLLFTRSTTGSDSSYTYETLSVGVNNFTQSGTYKIKLWNYVTTDTSPRPKISNYWDDVALFLVSTPQATDVKDNQTYFINIKAAGGDTTPPYFSNNTTNSTTAGTTVNFTINITDNNNLDSTAGYIFSTNNTGTWMNSSFISFSGSGTTLMAWNATTLNSTDGSLVQWKFYANDSNNNWNVSEVFNLTTTSGECTVAIGLSNTFANGVNFSSLDPGTTQDAVGNNGASQTSYNVSVSISGCSPNTVNVYIKGSGDLVSGSYSIPISNLKFRNSTTDNTVPSSLSNISLTTTHSDNKIGSLLTDGSYIHLKFRLTAPSGQAAASNYSNTISIWGGRSDQTPP